MDYLINITLTPKNSEALDLGNTCCSWDGKCLTFLDAPYDFYACVYEFLGDDETEGSPRDRFLSCFFDKLDSLISQHGFVDNLEFTLDMPPEFFGVAFVISIFTE
jgi:hypothetical protein